MKVLHDIFWGCKTFSNYDMVLVMVVVFVGVTCHFYN